MKALPAQHLVVAQASSLWGDRASCPVITIKTTGKMPVGPTARMAVLPENRLAELAPSAQTHEENPPGSGPC
jgi:hypothetical protein